jgi:hypothetical protein
MRLPFGESAASTDVACLALGSRGDAEPLLVVLVRVVARGGHRATFACRPRVWTELVECGAGVPAGVRHVPVRDCSVAMSIALAARRKGMDPQDVAGSGSISAQEADDFVQGERQDMLQSARGARLVICNLFCLEGWHIAEAIGAACLVLSPCLLPTHMPRGFQEEFAASMPTLYQRLIAEQQRQRRQIRSNPWEDARMLVSTGLYLCVCAQMHILVPSYTCAITHTHARTQTNRCKVLLG